jgi:ATP-dependent DNA helicase RecG
LRKTIQDALPFALTGAQQRALAEIDADLASPNRMLRLLQGDVGSGKTVVALLAMTKAIEAGAQAAFMAPTELLARQHLATISGFAAPAGLRVALLTGRERGRERDAILQALKDGDIDILIGTHALFQETIQFRDLALVVIDEQHRFGVHQRLALQAKGPGTGAELLVMTATPIPRTLLLTSYGDMDVTRLDEKPPGRKPIVTGTVPLERLDEVVAGVARAVAGGAQVYWVCPLVAESEVLDVAAAEDRYATLHAQFGNKVGLVHGRLTGKEKDAVMAQFASGALSILVSTTVIEVGVDVPNASIMIIEHAERFGLAQLHQLRGRVGRGAAESSCILLYRQPLGETARERLNVMRKTEDGFVIAEEDLRLRGGGEVLGTRQSGLPAFRIAILPEHRELLEAARDEARLRLARDPDLTAKDAEPLRLLLYLFERDDAIRLMRAG